MNLSNLSNKELILELKKRNLLTKSKSNDLLLTGEYSQDIKIILTYGEPKNQMKCRECNEIKDSSYFSFYQARVDNKGYLMRSNALCTTCSDNSNKERKKVLNAAIIPTKPKSGDTCPNCLREWEGNWHRHHVGNDFISYLCGHCNMSFSDQRTQINLIKEHNGDK